MGLSFWLPPIAWMAMILWFSSDSWSAEHTRAILWPLLEWLWPHGSPRVMSQIHGGIRKLAHLMVYAVLALLWFRALSQASRAPRSAGPRPGGATVGVSSNRVPALPAAWVALAISAAWAAVDELHQSTVASRVGSLPDVMVDLAGAGIAILTATWVRRSTTPLRGNAPS